MLVSMQHGGPAWSSIVAVCTPQQAPECWSQISMLAKMVMNLQMLPITVTVVAETASRSFQLKKFIARPTAQPTPSAQSPGTVTCEEGETS
jgi:hypothetical protein